MVQSSALMGAPSIGSHLGSALPAAASCDEQAFVLERRWHRAPNGAGAGLFNMGNTCYLNSVLQCLAHLPPLANLCYAKAHQRTCTRYQGGSTCICCLLEGQLFRQLYGNRGEFKPEQLHNYLLSLNRGFRRFQQEDAHELLRCLTDEMERCLLRQTRGYNPQRMPRCPKTWVNSLFSGILQSQVRCLHCGYVSNSYDPFMDLSLELKQGCSNLGQCFRNFTAAETLEGKNAYRCDGCKQLVSAKKQITIWDDPNVLVVHLKRFHDFSGQKIHQDIHYTATLDLEDYMCPTRRVQQQQQQQPQQQPQQQQQAVNFLAQPRVIQQQQQQRPVPAVYTNNGYKRPGMGVAKFNVVDRQQLQQQKHLLMQQQAQQHQQLVQKKLAAQQQPWHPHHEQQQPPSQHALAGPANRTAPGVYDLHGVLVHKGFTASSGHYYAFVRGGDPANQWYCANDSNVYRPQFNEALNQTRDAYMLFYVRRNMKQQADLPVQPEAPAAAPAAAAAAPAPVQLSTAAAAAQRLKRGNDAVIGPQLPPHLQQKRQRLQEQEQQGPEAMDMDDHPAAAAAAAGRVYGPQLPPGFQAAATGAAAAAAAGAGGGVSAATPTAADVVCAAAEPLPADTGAEPDLRAAAAAPRSPAAAAAARAAEARAAASAGARPVGSSSSSGTVLCSGLGAASGSVSARQAGLIPLAAATPAIPAEPAAAVGVNVEQPAALADYLPDYADEEDEEGEVAATPVQPAQQQHKHELPQQQQQQGGQRISSIGAAAGGNSSSSSAPSSSLGVEPAQIASKLAAELAGRPDCFKQPLVHMLQKYRDQGTSWRQVKPMLLLMLRQSAAVKEAADSVFAPLLDMARTAMAACL